jgi:hypothetical protein
MSGFCGRLLLPAALLLVACRQPATLIVDSTPAGAQIWLDGESTGLSTPQTIANLYAGLHVVDMRTSEGFNSKATVSLPVGETTRVAAEFPAVLWSYPDDTLEFYNTPTVSDNGMVYIVAGSAKTANRYYLLSFDGAGSWRWSVPVAAEMCSSPVIDDSGRILVTHSTAVAAFEADGSKLWEFADTAGGFVTGIALGAGSTVYAAARRRVHALSRAGEEFWVCACPDSVVCRMAVAADGTVYALSRSHLNAITPEGSVRWSCPVATGQAGPGLAIDGVGNVYCRKGQYFYCIGPDGLVRWKLEHSDTGQNTAPLVAADGLVLFNLEGRFYALRPDGTVAWYLDDDVRSAYGGACLAADGSILLGGTGWGWPGGDHDPGLFCLDAAGRLKWTFAPPPRQHWYTPVVAGNVLLAAKENTLWALRLQVGAAAAPWPVFQHDARHTGRAAPGR